MKRDWGLVQHQLMRITILTELTRGQYDTMILRREEREGGREEREGGREEREGGREEREGGREEREGGREEREGGREGERVKDSSVYTYQVTDDDSAEMIFV